jgi:superfamily I DNA/RNA helicase
MTSFEGAKGLSAQHVFIVGMHEGELPRDAKNIKDLEICRFLVGLTRVRKKCSILCTRRFAGERKTPSCFISWLKPERYHVTQVDAAYWNRDQK